MPDTSLIIPFLLATIVLLLIPGPAVLYTVARSVDQGRSAGLVSVLGLGVGTAIQVLGVTLGISAVILSSAVAFRILKVLGALYLIYLGIRRFQDREAPETHLNTRHSGLSRIFLQGILVDVLNPKTAVFILAFFPQFIDPSRGSYMGQVLFFGVLFVGLGLLFGGIYALLAGHLGVYFRKQGGFAKLNRYLAGSVYIGLGVVAAVTDIEKK